MLVDERVDGSWSRLVMLRRGRGLQVIIDLNDVLKPLEVNSWC